MPLTSGDDLEPSLACDFQVLNAGSSRGLLLSSTLTPAVSSCSFQHETPVSLATACQNTAPFMANATPHIRHILKIDVLD